MDIHNYKRRLEQSLAKIANLHIPSANKKAIQDFQTYLIVRGLSMARVEHYVYCLRILCNYIKQPFVTLTTLDVMRIVEEIQKRTDWSERYKRDFRITLRVFFRWLKERTGCAVDIGPIRTSHGKGRILPEQILTQDEVRKLAEAADNLRDRALVLVLYESGCRIGEILGLKVKHIQPHQHGFSLTVDGKTGSRRVLILSSVPALANWLNIHPYRDDPESYVWLGLSNRNKNELLAYPGVLMLLKELARRAGIKKRVNPHSFRHARATHLANYLTEAQMKQYFGWVQGSDMASIYVHLSGRDVDNALLKLSGISTSEEKKEEILKPVLCPRCRENNSSVSKFCSKCGSPLNIQTAMEVEQMRAEGDSIINELVSDPQIQQIIVKKIMTNEQLRAKFKSLV